MKKILSYLLILILIIPQQAIAQSLNALTNPSLALKVSDAFTPSMLHGMTLNPDNPFNFDFIVHPGEDQLAGQDLQDQSSTLIKYFLASLTTPEEDMWVNLSPHEPDRIIPKDFSQTAMGRDMLAQDYLLKQLTASLMSPMENMGKKFWEKIYAQAYDELGTTDIPVDTFNKVWIVPEVADVFENGDSVFVTDARMKVMLEEDYVSRIRASMVKEGSGERGEGRASMNSKNEQNVSGAEDQSFLHSNTHSPLSSLPSPRLNKLSSDLSSIVIRELIVPQIEKEVNEGKHFANLRQIYNALILASWYKTNLKESILGKQYVNQNKIDGITIEDKQAKQKIYDQYVKAFEQGVYNFIQEEHDPHTNKVIPRKYFSGGVDVAMVGDYVNGQGYVDKDVVRRVSESSAVTVNFKQTGQLEKIEEDAAKFDPMLTDNASLSDKEFTSVYQTIYRSKRRMAGDFHAEISQEVLEEMPKQTVIPIPSYLKVIFQHAIDNAVNHHPEVAKRREGVVDIEIKENDRQVLVIVENDFKLGKRLPDNIRNKSFNVKEALSLEVLEDDPDRDVEGGLTSDGVNDLSSAFSLMFSDYVLEDLMLDPSIAWYQSEKDGKTKVRFELRLPKLNVDLSMLADDALNAFDISSNRTVTSVVRRGKSVGWLVDEQDNPRLMLTELQSTSYPWKSNLSSEEQARFVGSWQEFLNRSHGQIPRPVRKGEDFLDFPFGEVFHSIDGKILLLEEVVSGEEMSRRDAKPFHYYQVGRMLSLMHNQSQKFEQETSIEVIPENTLLDYLKSHDQMENAQRYQTQLGESLYESVRLAQVYFEGIVDHIDLNSLPQVIGHGDANVTNFLTSARDVTGVIDHVESAKMNRLMDMAEVLSRMGYGQEGYWYYNYDQVKALVKGYDDHADVKLSSDELKVLAAALLAKPLSRLAMSAARDQEEIPHDELRGMKKFIDQLISDIDGKKFKTDILQQDHVNNPYDTYGVQENTSVLFERSFDLLYRNDHSASYDDAIDLIKKQLGSYEIKDDEEDSLGSLLYHVLDNAAGHGGEGDGYQAKVNVQILHSENEYILNIDNELMRVESLPIALEGRIFDNHNLTALGRDETPGADYSGGRFGLGIGWILRSLRSMTQHKLPEDVFSPSFRYYTIEKDGKKKVRFQLRLPKFGNDRASVSDSNTVVFESEKLKLNDVHNLSPGRTVYEKQVNEEYDIALPSNLLVDSDLYHLTHLMKDLIYNAQNSAQKRLGFQHRISYKMSIHPSEEEYGFFKLTISQPVSQEATKTNSVSDWKNLRLFEEFHRDLSTFEEFKDRRENSDTVRNSEGKGMEYLVEAAYAKPIVVQFNRKNAEPYPIETTLYVRASNEDLYFLGGLKEANELVALRKGVLSIESNEYAEEDGRVQINDSFLSQYRPKVKLLMENLREEYDQIPDRYQAKQKKRLKRLLNTPRLMNGPIIIKSDQGQAFDRYHYVKVKEKAIAKAATEVFNRMFNEVFEEVFGGDASSFAETPGGIDFNPQHLPLKKKGQMNPELFQVDPAMLNQQPLKGLFPVILNIRPVTNVEFLLGVGI